MADTSELSALVVRNITDLEAAIIQAGEIDTRLIEDVGAMIADAVDAGDWHVHVDAEQRDIWFALRSWLQRDVDPIDADYWFAVEEQTGPTGDTDETWLAAFLQAGPSQAIAALYFSGATFKAKRRWKQLLDAGADQIERLLAAGFRQDDTQKLYLPLLLDQEALAAGFDQDDLTPALQPVRDALAVIAKVRGDLEALVALDRGMT